MTLKVKMQVVFLITMIAWFVFIGSVVVFFTSTVDVIHTEKQQLLDNDLKF